MRKILSIILLPLLFGCANVQPNFDFEQVLASLPNVYGPETICGYTSSDAFRLSYSTWIDSTDIRYFIEYSKVYKDGKEVSYFNNSDRDYIKDQTAKAFNAWKDHVGKPVKEVSTKKDANMVIVFKFLDDDGVGGMLALADFPPAKGDYVKRGEIKYTYVRIDLADMWEYVKKRDKAKNPYYTVILHELGHALAGLRHDDAHSVMNPNNKFKNIRIDDVQGARINYRKFENFDFEGNRYTFIDAKNKSKKASKNFTNGELLSHCRYLNYPNGHFVSVYTISGLQYLREYYGVPIKILSSYRDKACNDAAQGAEFSQHLYVNALDWKFIGPKAAATQKLFVRDIRLQSIVLQTLIEMGCRSFGTYPYGYGTNHIDSREVIKGNSRIRNREYIVWGSFVPSRERAMMVEGDFKKYD